MGRFLSNLTFKYFLRLELDRHSSPKFLDTYTQVCVHDIDITTHQILSETGIGSTQLTEAPRTSTYVYVHDIDITTHQILSEAESGSTQLTEAV